MIAALGRHLTELVPFDDGELVLPKVFGYERWSLTGGSDPLVSDDLLADLIDQTTPVRVDDVSSINGHDRGRAALLERRIETLLILPLSSAGGPRGVVVLGGSSTWGFAGAPLATITDLVGMAGLSLETAAALTKVRRDADNAAAELERLKTAKGRLG